MPMSPNVMNTGEKKKVFVTGSGNIEVTQVSQPISHSPNIAPHIAPNITTNVSGRHNGNYSDAKTETGKQSVTSQKMCLIPNR